MRSSQNTEPSDAPPSTALPLYQIIEEEHRALHEGDPTFKDPSIASASLLPFDASQIRDPQDLARKLQEVGPVGRVSRPAHPRDPVCEYLLREDAAHPCDPPLNASLHGFIAAQCRLDSPAALTFTAALAASFNALVDHEFLPEIPVFKDLPLNPYASELRSRAMGLRQSQTKTLPDSMRRELNRLLIEAAFPTQLQRLRDRRLDNVYASIREHTHAALCLSGGGIRSATFGLGVIQGLAHHGLLSAFDYLSTVSGGGYVGGWLTAWMAHAGPDYVESQLRDTGSTWAAAKKLEPEPTPLRHLRAYSNFLSPRAGLLSADTWTLVATYARNLLLTWLVLVPLLASAAMVPWIVVAIIKSNLSGMSVALIGVLGLLFGIAAIRFVHDTRPIEESITERRRAAAGQTQRVFIRRCFFPLLISGVLLTTAWALWIHSQPPEAIEQRPRLWLWFGVVGVVLHGGAWSIAAWQNRRGHLTEMFAALASGFGLGWLTYHAALGLVEFKRFDATIEPLIYATLALPTFLAILTLGGQLFLGLVSRWTTDAEREWGARFNAWLLVGLSSWLVICGIVLFGPLVVQRIAPDLLQQILVGGIGGASALTTVLLGSSSKTAGKQGHDDPSPAKGKSDSLGLGGLVRRYTMGTAVPILVVSILIALSFLDAEILGLFCRAENALMGFERCEYADGLLNTATGVTAISAIVACVSLVMIGTILGRLIDTNKFSLHAMYRARLIRAFLGASRPAGERHPDPFTGFDDHDNLRMHQLWPAASAARPLEVDTPPVPGAHPRRGSNRPPIPVINLALNVVNNPNLAWQERKAASFSVTPLHAGSLFVGYRRTSPPALPLPPTNAGVQRYRPPPPVPVDHDLYGHGISLGTAMTISGAAASPNAGYHSSPLVTFLMTLFNARLGAWLGNPGPPGERTFKLRSPRQTAVSIVAELFGFTNDRSEYVYLSDGGHFDNLGLYEMVLRRCRFIVVSDASCDETSSFEDLGNAIRRIRVDLGVPIEFENELPIFPRSANRGDDGQYWAVGRIKYSEIDRPRSTDKASDGDGDGTLIYIKPAFYGGKEPRDVYNYAQTNLSFPHESTADQFYSESQFESYRALGRFIIDQICAQEPSVRSMMQAEPKRDSEPLRWLEYHARKTSSIIVPPAGTMPTPPANTPPAKRPSH